MLLKLIMKIFGIVKNNMSHVLLVSHLYTGPLLLFLILPQNLLLDTSGNINSDEYKLQAHDPIK